MVAPVAESNVFEIGFITYFKDTGIRIVAALKCPSGGN
ncbi:hypothetical protein AM1_4775 [Acaryochloris marina MBIC11017]|uniref:Uncharacterized protein n=1 Tax=Acaryochloris marina (strain MBIC 11017) TaxID=329726 RepID=B0C2F6_ACAM1|nr:hypothetical protein AM1_4775 [Acaryochloris marina MBIC11017]